MENMIVLGPDGIPGGLNRERKRAITVVVAPVVYNALYDVARRPGNRLPVGADTAPSSAIRY
jgi:hypothetical protein